MNRNHKRNLILLVLAIFALYPVEAKGKHKACFKAPIYVYDEELGKYYRQDWCHIGKSVIYYDSIPVPSNGERGENVLLS